MEVRIDQAKSSTGSTGMYSWMWLQGSESTLMYCVEVILEKWAYSASMATQALSAKYKYKYKDNFEMNISSYKETDSSAHLVRYQNKQAQIKDEQDFTLLDQLNLKMIIDWG